MTKSVVEVISWVLLAAVLVLVLTHAASFSRSVTTVGDESNKVLGTLSGAGTIQEVQR